MADVLNYWQNKIGSVILAVLLRKILIVFEKQVRCPQIYQLSEAWCFREISGSLLNFAKKNQQKNKQTVQSEKLRVSNCGFIDNASVVRDGNRKIWAS